jgi:hypothetical protein
VLPSRHKPLLRSGSGGARCGGTIKWHVSQILATNTSNRAEAITRILGTPQ